MSGIGVLIAEWLITALIVYAGLSGKRVLFINGPRTAVITLGAIGFVLCMTMPTIGTFIRNAPAHPLTIVGYLFGVAALLTTAVQIFTGDVPFIGDSQTALFIIAFCIMSKSIIGRFARRVVRPADEVTGNA